jgi:hypothetical protein
MPADLDHPSARAPPSKRDNGARLLTHRVSATADPGQTRAGGVAAVLIEASWWGESGGASPDHRYELFERGRSLGWLEWRPRPRERLGWYLRRHGGSPVALSVDLAIDDLAAAERRDEHGWELTAEIAALLSTALALDQAERVLHPRPHQPRRPVVGRRDSFRCWIVCAGLDPDVLARAVPELPLSSMGDAVLLDGHLPQEALELVIRRIQLLGGRVLTLPPDATGT